MGLAIVTRTEGERGVMTNLFLRDGVSRASQFLDLADCCRIDERDQFEMFLEAAIVFSRVALHRLQHQYGRNPGWNPWWTVLSQDESIIFVRKERDHLLKEGPAHIGQRIRLDKQTTLADEHYYIEDPNVPATTTIRRHLQRVREIVADGTTRFGS